MKKKFSNFLKDFNNIRKKPIMEVLPGQLAFSFILTIIPILAIIGLIALFFSISIGSLIEFVSETFPSDTSKVLIPLIEGKGFDASIIVFVISAFLLASGGAYSVITTSNLLYEINQPNPLKKRFKSFVITFILLTLITFLIIVPGFGDYIIDIIKSSSIINPIYNYLNIGYALLKYPISFVIVYINIKLIYTISPDQTVLSKNVTRGALFTSFMWIVLTRFYSYYVTNFVQYDIFYGSLSNIIILLLWFYLLSYIFVIGLALNADRYLKLKKLKVL